MTTVREATFALLARLGLTTIVGNPGSTEEPFLADLPQEFSYVLALHEGSAVAIADGLAQGLRRPVLVNLHTNAGLGNAMGNLITAFVSKTPLLITAGQQTRRMLLGEPFLSSPEAETLPKPWIKWSHEPRRPQDVPAAFLRAWRIATQQPMGPVFLSLPMDDWDQPVDEMDIFRCLTAQPGPGSLIGPDPARLGAFAEQINASRAPALVYGGDVARSGAWEEAIALAETLQAPVWLAPLPELVPFPRTHRLFQGNLPPAIGPLSQALAGHDLIVVIGAPVFRYYPFVPGHYLPEGARLLHITDDPAEAARAVAGESLVADSRLALRALLDAVDRREPAAEVGHADRKVATAQTRESLARLPLPLTGPQLYDVLSRALPPDLEYLVALESPSSMFEFPLSGLGTITRPDSYYMTASGGIGWALPAAVGLAMAERDSGRHRPVIAVLGDGSLQYSIQALWTAVQQGVHLVCVVLRNEEYAILKNFAAKEQLANVPGLDLPGIDCVALARGYGAAAQRAETVQDIAAAFATALGARQVTVLEVPIARTGV